MQNIINKVYHGDCLEVMQCWPAQSVNAVITDPPYMIGSKSVGNKNLKSGDWIDMLNSAYWYAAWMKEVYRLLTNDGWLVLCGNWRSIPTYTYALSMIGRSINSCLVWDKEWIGCGSKAQLRPTYELVMFCGMPDAIIKNRSLSDIFRCKWQATLGKTGHPAEKPLDLMVHICKTVCPDGGVVLDPFAGSGTVCVAAKISGCDFIGIEAEENYYRLANERTKGALCNHRR